MIPRLFACDMVVSHEARDVKCMRILGRLGDSQPSMSLSKNVIHGESEKQQQMRAPCSSKRAAYHYKGVCSIMACHFISMCAHTNIHRVTRTVTIMNSNTVEAG